VTEQQTTTRDLAEASAAEASRPDTGTTGEGDDRHEHESQRSASASEPTDAADEQATLLPADQSERFTERWQEIQASFVDQPRQSVEQADALVADLMQRLAAGFSTERERLEGQWDRGDDISTEELRVVLTRYRSFFGRLLEA
jgi:hypothetical protein